MHLNFNEMVIGFALMWSSSVRDVLKFARDLNSHSFEFDIKSSHLLEKSTKNNVGT